MTTLKLLDNTDVPWLAWGPGSLDAGKLAIAAGIRHIDTAQLYRTEAETAQAISESSVSREEIYVTSKLSEKGPGDELYSLEEIRGSVQRSIEKLGFIPELYLIHNPFIVDPKHLKELWKVLEDLKSEGKLKSIGVSNFRPQDLEVILDGAKYKPVVNQIEFHPYVLAHLEPLLALQAKHNIVTASFGCLTPILRHSGGPLKPVLKRIADRLSTATGKNIDSTSVLILWIRAQGAIAVTSSKAADRIKLLGELYTLPDLLEKKEIDEISNVGKTVHFRHYKEHMQQNFPLPNLPSGL